MMTSFARQLLEWYQTNKRNLPWRNPSGQGSRDAYAVWVSEIMLQQTRVETVIPYFLRWMERFPTVSSLAAASQQDVLAAWEGLGYYSRARNLHRAAQIVVADYGGALPSDVKELQSLPGIGRYTAGAIASIAFSEDQPALDGNIRRVLSRVFNVGIPVRSPEGERILWQLAAEHLPTGQAGDYNQAMMDLASAICTPRSPDCPVCPLADLCEARQLGIQEERPILAPRKDVPHYLVTAAVLQRDGQVLVARRPANGLLGGLWEFPGGKVQDGEDLPTCLRREIDEELGLPIEVGEQLGVYQHGYTHFKVTLYAFFCRILNGEPRMLHHSALEWASLAQLQDYPMGKIDRQIARDLVRCA